MVEFISDTPENIACAVLGTPTTETRWNYLKNGGVVSRGTTTKR